MITCKNCGNTFEGNYCNTCGQDAAVGRITGKDILHQLPHGLFHVDGGLLHTVRELSLRPGQSIKEYLDGKRVDHFNPFMYLMIMGGLVTFLFLSFKLKLILQDYSVATIEHKNHFLGAKYFIMMGGFWILLSSTIDVLLHRKSGFNFAEMVIANTFQSAHVMFMLLMFLPVLILQRYLRSELGFEFDIRMLFILLVCSFLFYTRYQLFKERTRFIAVSKILIYLTLIILSLHYIPLWIMG